MPRIFLECLVDICIFIEPDYRNDVLILFLR